MAAPTYQYAGTIVISREQFDAWVAAMLPQGPFYATGMPEWLDLQTMRVPYNASNSGAPEMPVLFPAPMPV